MTENLSILGSTGSIGKQSLDVCRKCGYGVKALTAFSSVDEIEKQARELSPKRLRLLTKRRQPTLKLSLPIPI